MWKHLDEEGLKEKLRQLDERQWTDEELRAAGEELGLPGTTPFYTESGWNKQPNENPVFETLLSMLRVTSPWAVEREKRRLEEKQDYGWAERNLVEMAKLCCISKEAGRPDLSGFDLSGLDLRRTALAGVILSHPSLERHFPPLWREPFVSERPVGLYANLKGAFLRPENLYGVSEEEWKRRMDVREKLQENYEGLEDGRVWWIASKAEPVPVTMFDNISRAVYYYCMKDGKHFTVCGCSFPDIPKEKTVLAVCALHIPEILMMCTEEEVLFFHTHSGARTHRNGKFCIPVPEGIRIKAARFAPGGSSLELTLTEPVNGSFCVSWNLFFREQGTDELHFYETSEQTGDILGTECLQEDYEKATDSKKRYLITETRICHPDGQRFTERKGKDDMTPCSFREEEIVWVREDRAVRISEKTNPLARCWAALIEFADVESEGDEMRGDQIRTFFWEIPGKKKAVRRLRSSCCQGPQTSDYAKRSWIGFYDGALELEEGAVHRYVFHENGVIGFYRGEPTPGGFWIGCPGVDERLVSEQEYL